jgi:predicted transcriptional regulator
MANIKFDVEQAKHLRQQGHTYTEVAELMGCSLPWVKQHLRGVTKGSNKVFVDATKLEAIKILKEALKKLEEL